MSAPIPSAAASGSFLIGGDLPVNRLGYGTMRLVGDGAWASASSQPIAYCAGLSSWALR